MVELYLTAPAGKMDKPEEELKGICQDPFAETRGITDRSNVLDASSLASFNTSLTRWVADAGTYQVKIGGSAEDILLKKEFTLEKKSCCRN